MSSLRMPGSVSGISISAFMRRIIAIMRSAPSFKGALSSQSFSAQASSQSFLWALSP